MSSTGFSGAGRMSRWISWSNVARGSVRARYGSKAATERSSCPQMIRAEAAPNAGVSEQLLSSSSESLLLSSSSPPALSTAFALLLSACGRTMKTPLLAGTNLCVCPSADFASSIELMASDTATAGRGCPPGPVAKVAANSIGLVRSSSRPVSRPATISAICSLPGIGIPVHMPTSFTAPSGCAMRPVITRPAGSGTADRSIAGAGGGAATVGVTGGGVASSPPPHPREAKVARPVERRNGSERSRARERISGGSLREKSAYVRRCRSVSVRNHSSGAWAYVMESDSLHAGPGPTVISAFRQVRLSAQPEPARSGRAHERADARARRRRLGKNARHHAADRASRRARSSGAGDRPRSRSRTRPRVRWPSAFIRRSSSKKARRHVGPVADARPSRSSRCRRSTPSVCRS